MTVRMSSIFLDPDSQSAAGSGANHTNNQASPGSSDSTSPRSSALISHTPYNWFYDKSELKRTPSFFDGINFERERRYRNEGARFILNVGSQMKLRYNTLATGVVYFHRFYMFHSFKVFPRYVTAACCLFLAGKAEETPKKCKDIIRIARTLLTDTQFQTFGEDPKEEVLTMERIVLQTIRFDLQVEHPYKYLVNYAKGFKGNKEKIHMVLQMAWTFTNDSLCTTICLQWEPEIVAIAMIFLASKIKYEITDWERRLPHQKHWWDIYVEDLTVEMLEDVCHQVLDLYSRPYPDEVRDSPPMSPARSGLGANSSAAGAPNVQANHLAGGLQAPLPPPVRPQPPPPPPGLPPVAPQMISANVPNRLFMPSAVAAQNGSAAPGPLVVPPPPPPPPPMQQQWDPNAMASFYNAGPFPFAGMNASGPPGGPLHLAPGMPPTGLPLLRPLRPLGGLPPRGMPLPHELQSLPPQLQYDHFPLGQRKP